MNAPPVRLGRAAATLAASAVALLSASTAVAQHADETAPVVESRTLVERAPAAAGTTIIDGDTLRDEGATSLGDALELSTGVSLTRQSGLGTSATIDGLPAGQVTVLVDGVPVGRPLNSRAGPAFDVASLPVDLSTVDRIVVTRGLGPAGSGTSGGIIIQILTNDTRTEPEVFIDLEAGANRAGVDGGHLQVGASAPVSERVTVTSRAQGATDTAQDATGDGRPDAPSRRIGQLSTGVDLRGDRGGRLHLGAEYAFARTRRHTFTTEREQALRSDTPAALNGLFDDRTDHHRALVRVDADTPHGASWRLRTATSWQLQQIAFDKIRLTDDALEPNQTTRDHTVRENLVGTWRGGAHLVEPELDLQLQHTTRDGGETALSRTAFVAAAGGTWRVQPTDATQLGVRLVGDAHTDFGAGGVAGVDAEVKAGDALTLRAAGARSRRLPIPEERYFRFDHSEVGYVLVGNPNLAPERLWSARAGVRVDAGRWALDAEGFYHRLDRTIGFDVIPNAGAAATYRYVNVGQVESAGATGSVGGPLAGSGLSVHASYTVIPHSTSEQTGGRAPLTPVHDADLRVSGAWSRDRVGGWAQGSVRSDAADVDGRRTGVVGALDLGVWGQLAPAWRLTARVDNATDTFNPIVGPFDPVTVRLALRYDTH